MVYGQCVMKARDQDPDEVRYMFAVFRVSGLGEVLSLTLKITGVLV